jgi:transglutaminase-like putative cysteine protease
MRLDTAVRLVFYLTLAMACACLSYAEIHFLWWMPAVLALTLALLAVAFRVEGRWSLSHDQANVLAVAIALGTVVWIIAQLPRTDEEVLASEVPWPAGLLPHVGPLLVLLLVVKVFRPKKSADFWGTQTIGLLIVMLACILTGDPLFGVFLVAYLGCLLWCLALFYWYREHGGRDRSAILAPDPAAPVVPWHGGGLARAALWTGLVSAAGFLLFLLAPRPTSAQWNPVKLASNTALRPSLVDMDGIDLKRTGLVTLSDRVAFTVVAEDNQGRAKTNLSLNQRWRSEMLDVYDDGRWRASFPMDKQPPAVQPRFPDLGDKQYFLTFAIPPDHVGFLVLAEPVLLEPAIPVKRLPPVGAPPRAAPPKQPPLPFREIPEAGALVSYVPAFRKFRVGPRYQQVLLPDSHPDLYPAHHVTPKYARSLVEQELPPGIDDFSRSLVARLPALIAADRALDSRGEILEKNRIRVAQELCRYLTSSGEYTFTLNLRRKDESLDPTVDFLVNLKQGHCSRYAGALALMLRSLGMPARVVQGYLGLEHHGDGLYYVRYKQAHSWVEVLVPDTDKPSSWNWLVLDATPSEQASEQGLDVVINWLSDNWTNGRALWRELILNYDTDRQRQAVTAVWQSMSRPETLLPAGRLAIRGGLIVVTALVGLALCLIARRLLARGRARRVRSAAAPAGFYTRLLAVLGQRCRLFPGAGQTPREFGMLAAVCVAPSVPAALAAVPLQIVDLLYRARYGAYPLSAAEEAHIAQKIDELDRALRK